MAMTIEDIKAIIYLIVVCVVEALMVDYWFFKKDK